MNNTPDTINEGLLQKACKDYVDEITQPGVPVISTTHLKLARLYRMFGKAEAQAEVDRQLAEIREY